VIEERVVDVQHEALLSGARWIHDLDRKLHVKHTTNDTVTRRATAATDFIMPIERQRGVRS
jgi:hypothetical protein